MIDSQPAESKWLYNQPSPGVVRDWYQRNKQAILKQWIDPRVLDGGFILASTVEEMDGRLPQRYSSTRVVITKSGIEVPSKDSLLYKALQDHKTAMAAKQERDGEKYSVRRFSQFLSDRELRIAFSDWSWSGMELTNDVNKGQLPEDLRDTILPTLGPDGYIFNGQLPNFAAIQGIIVTSDRHLVLTTRAQQADYYQGTVSPSFEEQMDRAKDESPFDTFSRAVSYSPKLKLRGEELRLNVKPQNTRLVSVILEPQHNSVSFVMLGVCEETSAEIDPTKLGVDRAEFNPRKPIWTLPLETPDELIKNFHDSSVNWHGIGRERVVTALALVNGYDEALDRLYAARP